MYVLKLHILSIYLRIHMQIVMSYTIKNRKYLYIMYLLTRTYTFLVFRKLNLVGNKPYIIDSFVHNSILGYNLGKT